MKENGIEIGTRLRKYRTLKGFSQEYMADVLHISQKTYSNMENNKSSISLDVLKKLAEELGVDIMELISDDKVIVQNNTSHDSSSFQGGIIVNYLSKELLEQMKERIDELKEQIKEKDKRIFELEKKLFK